MFKDQGIGNTRFAYQDLGEYLVAPLLAKAFLKLYEVAEKTKNPIILFPAREGWFFQKLWLFCVSEGYFSEKIPTKYFYANRRAVNRSHRLLSDEFLPSIAYAHFDGHFEAFFESRLGLSGESVRSFLANTGITASDWLSLPSDQDLLILTLRKLKGRAESFGLVSDSVNYKNYLLDVVGDRTPIFFDLGYSGSVVESLHHFLKKEITSVFFQVHLSRGQSNIFRLQNCISALTAPCYPDSPNALGGIAHILESIFRAPEKGFITVDPRHRPVFDKTEEISEESLDNLGLIIAGVESGLSNILKNSSMDASLIDKLCDLVLLAASTGGFAADKEALLALSLEELYSGRRVLPSVKP